MEAQSFGLPVIAQQTGSTHTINETIDDGKTGFIINNSRASGEQRVFDKKIVQEFVEKIEKLIKDKKTRENMSKHCIKQIKTGKFSIKERNKKLTRIYREALKEHEK